MNRVVVAVLGLMLASPLAVVALEGMGIGPGFRVDAPDWDPGMTWTYDVIGSGKARGSVLGFGAETETGRFSAERRSAVVNTTHTIGDDAVYATLETFRLKAASYGDKNLPAETDPDATMSAFGADLACLLPCGTLVAFRTHDDLAYHFGELDPENGMDMRLKLLDFPLTRNKEWTVIGHSAPEKGFEFEIRAKAVDKEYIRINGFDPLETVRIEAQVTEASKEVVRGMATGAAAEADVRLDLDFDITFEYWYSPKIGQIVELDASSFVAGRGSGYGAAGVFRMDTNLHETLTGHEDVERAEMPIREAYALARAAWEDPETAPKVAREPWRFTAAAATTSIEARDGATVDIGLVEGWNAGDQAASFDATPDGATVTWTHRYFEGDVPRTKTYDGRVIDLPIEHAGLHTVTARVYDADGALLGTDDLILEGYTKVSWESSGPVGLGPVGSTGAELRFPVARDAGFIQHTITAAGTVDGMYALVDPAGEPADRGQAQLTQDTFTSTLPFGKADGEWTLAWEEARRVDTVTIDIEVRYDRDAGSETSDGDDGAPAALSWTIGHLLGLA